MADEGERASYAELRKLISDARQHVSRVGFDVPYAFLETTAEETREVLNAYYDLADAACRIGEETPPIGYDEDFRHMIWAMVHSIGDVRGRIFASKIDAHDYFLLQVLAADLEVGHELCMTAEAEFLAAPPNHYIYSELSAIAARAGLPATPEQIKQEVQKVQRKLDHSKLRWIQIPGEDTGDPLSWALLSHETLHHSELPRKLRQLLPAEFIARIPENKLDEVLVDLLALNYLGPAYAGILLTQPTKIGDHIGQEHPSLETRRAYCREILAWTEDKLSGSGSEEVAADICREFIRALPSSLLQARTKPADAVIGEAIADDIQAIQESVAELLQKNGTWWQCVAREVPRSGMRFASSEYAAEIFTLASKRQILPIVHPAILFNIISSAMRGTVETKTRAQIRRSMQIATRKYAVLRSSSPTLVPAEALD